MLLFAYCALPELGPCDRSNQPGIHQRQAAGKQMAAAQQQGVVVLNPALLSCCAASLGAAISWKFITTIYNSQPEKYFSFVQEVTKQPLK